MLDQLLEQIKSESMAVQDLPIEQYALLCDRIRKICFSITYGSIQLDDKTIVKLTSGLIGLYSMQQNRK